MAYLTPFPFLGRLRCQGIDGQLALLTRFHLTRTILKSLEVAPKKMHKTSTRTCWTPAAVKPHPLTSVAVSFDWDLSLSHCRSAEVFKSNYFLQKLQSWGFTSASRSHHKSSNGETRIQKPKLISSTRLKRATLYGSSFLGLCILELNFTLKAESGHMNVHKQSSRETTSGTPLKFFDHA